MAVGVKISVPRSAWGLLLLVAACEVVPETTVASEEATRTHALLRVERSALVGAEDEATGMAFAGVLRVPEMTDPGPLLRLSGSGLSLPSAGTCAAVNRERSVVGSIGRAEFLEAGDVTLRASETETLLAPRLFESSQTELSGVAYSSRDRASEPVPGGAAYVLKTTGSDQLPALELRVQAPEVLSDVTVAGVALAEVSAVGAANEVAVSWRPGDARDWVYVEVTGSTDAGTLGVCAFRDSDGRGSLPRGLFGAAGTGSLAFHRLREVAADVGALDAAEARFDFELTAEVSFH